MGAVSTWHGPGVPNAEFRVGGPFQPMNHRRDADATSVPGGQVRLPWLPADRLGAAGISWRIPHPSLRLDPWELALFRTSGLRPSLKSEDWNAGTMEYWNGGVSRPPRIGFVSHDCPRWRTTSGPAAHRPSRLARRELALFVQPTPAPADSRKLALFRRSPVHV
jgi:hypothetical protein